MGISANSIPSNFEVLTSVSQLIKTLNATPGFIRLFRNNFTPTYASILSDFVECNFAGYAPQSLSGVFPDPSKQQDGFYASTSKIITFSNTGLVDAVTYGFWIVAGSQWYWAGDFGGATPIPAGETLQFTLTWQSADVTLVCI